MRTDNLDGVWVTSDVRYLRQLSWSKIVHTLNTLEDALREADFQGGKIQVKYWNTWVRSSSRPRVLTVLELDPDDHVLRLRDLPLRGGVVVDVWYFENPAKRDEWRPLIESIRLDLPKV